MLRILLWLVTACLMIIFPDLTAFFFVVETVHMGVGILKYVVGFCRHRWLIYVAIVDGSNLISYVFTRPFSSYSQKQTPVQERFTFYLACISAAVQSSYFTRDSTGSKSRDAYFSTYVAMVPKKLVNIIKTCIRERFVKTFSAMDTCCASWIFILIGHYGKKNASIFVNLSMKPSTRPESFIEDAVTSGT